MKTLFDYPANTFGTAEEIMRAIAAVFSDTFGWENEEETDENGALTKITIYVDGENGTGLLLIKANNTAVNFYTSAKANISLGNFQSNSNASMSYEKSKDETAVFFQAYNYFTVAETTSGARNIISIYSNYLAETQGEQACLNGNVKTSAPAVDTISLTPMLSGYGGAYKELYYVVFSSLNSEAKPLYYQKDGHKFLTNNIATYRYAMKVE